MFAGSVRSTAQMTRPWLVALSWRPCESLTCVVTGTAIRALRIRGGRCDPGQQILQPIGGAGPARRDGTHTDVGENFPFDRTVPTSSSCCLPCRVACTSFRSTSADWQLPRFSAGR